MVIVKFETMMQQQRQSTSVNICKQSNKSNLHEYTIQYTKLVETKLKHN